MNISKIKSYINWVKLAKQTLKLKNLPIACCLRLGIIKNGTIKTKTLGTFKIENNALIIKIINNIMEFQYYVLKKNNVETVKPFKDFINQIIDKKNIVTYEGISFLKNNQVFILCENFFENGNNPFSDYKNSIVVDVGCNIGDTSLLFAKNGCEVYAFEPVPDIYQIATENINLNPKLKNKIHLYNKAISDKKEIINIYYEELAGAGSSRFSIRGKKYSIEAITLDEVTSKLNKDNNAKILLQMDCEGSEFDIIPKSDLAIFDEIVVEYHSKTRNIPKDIIINELKNQGFYIKNIYPAPVINLSLDEIGIIHAIKNNDN